MNPLPYTAKPGLPFLRLAACLLIISMSFSVSAKPKKFTLQGKTSDKDSGMILFRILTQQKTDTLEIRNATFSYESLLDEVTPFILSDPQNHYQLFFAEPSSKMHIELETASMQVRSCTGSAAQDLFAQLIAKQEPIQKAMELLNQTSRKAGINRDSLQQVAIQLTDQRNRQFYEFLKEHGNSPVTSFLVYNSIAESRGMDLQVADSLYSLLREEGKTSYYGRESEKAIQKLKAVTIGFEAPDFTLPDSSGKQQYSLSAYRGKYVLVDFWASWCGPCKAEIPYLKEAYKNFHDKGFEILSVSLDDKREAWLQALRQFLMPWAQISDVKGFRSLVNDLYPIPSIPKTLLLDKQGVIIATDLRGPALEQKLKELMP